MSLFIRWVWIPSLVLAACSPVAPAVPTARPTEWPSPTAAPPQPPEPEVTPGMTVSFPPATYTDAAAGFAFDYPASWMAEAPAGAGARGSYAQFTSWTHPPGGITEVPADGTILQATVQLWDPRNELQSFLVYQQGAWTGSGSTIVSQENRALPNGQPAASYVVQGSDGVQSYFFITTLTDAYLILSGGGDLALLDEIAGTLRRLSAPDS